jgi:hypothetical protein
MDTELDQHNVDCFSSNAGDQTSHEAVSYEVQSGMKMPARKRTNEEGGPPPAGTPVSVTPRSKIKKRKKLKITPLDHLCNPILSHERIADRDYAGCLLLLSKADRLDGFMSLAPCLTDRQFWKLLADVWTDAEGPCYRIGEWQRLFRSRRSGRTAAMNAVERRVLSRLPAMIRIYRGSSAARNRGMSWSGDVFLWLQGPSTVSEGGVVRNRKEERHCTFQWP